MDCGWLVALPRPGFCGCDVTVRAIDASSSSFTGMAFHTGHCCCSAQVVTALPRQLISSALQTRRTARYPCPRSTPGLVFGNVSPSRLSRRLPYRSSPAEKRPRSADWPLHLAVPLPLLFLAAWHLSSVSM